MTAHRFRPGDVGVGVGDEQGDAGLDEPMHHRALGGVRGDRADAAEQQRMVGQQQLRATGHRLGHGLRNTVDGHVDPTHFSRRISDDEPDRVPGFGPGLRVPLVQGRGKARQSNHETTRYP